MSKEKFLITCETSTGKALIVIRGVISEWNNYAEQFKGLIDNAIAAGIKDCDLDINTPGGDCFEANEIGNLISRFTGTKTAKLGALCASAGTYIASCCNVVIAAENTQYMIHKPSMYVYGNQDEVTSELKLLKNLQDLYAKKYADKTGMTVDKIESLWPNDYWMSAQEAKSLGFVDQITGEAEITNDDITAIAACGYKTAPKMTATLKPQANTNTNLMKEILITALALQATATDAQILAAVDLLKAKAAKSDEYKTQVEALTKTANETRINAVLDAAELNKQTTPAQRAFYKAGLERDFDGTKAHIDALPKVAKLSASASGNSKQSAANNEDRSGWTYAMYMEKDPEALAVMAETDEENYNKLAKAHYGKDWA